MTRTTRWLRRRAVGAHALSAVLVESRRVGGQPLQRFVIHLGTIQVSERGMSDVRIASGGRAPRWAVAAFWDCVARKLDAVEEPFDREAVEDMIAARVPRPSLDAAVPIRGQDVFGSSIDATVVSSSSAGPPA